MKSRKLNTVLPPVAASSSASSSSTVRRGFTFSANRARVSAFSVIPKKHQDSIWAQWMLGMNNGIKGASLSGILKKVWHNEKGSTLVLEVSLDALATTLGCDVRMLTEFPDYMKFIPWGMGEEDGYLYMKVKNSQESPEVTDAFFEGVRLPTGEWALEKEVKMLVNVTSFCNFPEPGDIGVSVKMVTPVKIVETSKEMITNDFDATMFENIDFQ